MDITTLFCEIDDFCGDFEPMLNEHLISDGNRKRFRKSTLALSEVMTIIVEFQRSGYRAFKHYYQRHVCVYLRWAFPQVVSYNRFVELMADALLPLWISGSISTESYGFNQGHGPEIERKPLIVPKLRRS